ncbi:MAG: VanW family protein [Chthonomonadales bacterium]
MAHYVKATRVCFLALLMAGAAGAGTLAAMSRSGEEVVAPGIHVAGMDWSGRTLDAARVDLEQWAIQQTSRPFIMIARLPEGRTLEWSPPRGALGASVDIEATMDQVRRAGEGRNVFERIVEWFAGKRTVDVAPAWRIEDHTLRAYLLKHVAPRVRRVPRDARFIPSANGYRTLPDRSGLRLDLEQAAALCAQRLPLAGADPLPLPLVQVAPHVRTSDVASIRGELAHFTTHYSERGNRARNIIVACRRINGIVLKPGDVFSYNQVVGPRDISSGFRIAPVIIHGQLKPGMGGGVCQVSSTLYNAVALAGLQIVRREHHAFPVHYVPPGRDATVAYGAIDFRFRNNTQSAVAIAADGTRGRVVMRIFGRPNPGRRISIVRTRVESWPPPVQVVRDPSLPEGVRRVLDRGHAGHRVTVLRVVKEGGRVVRREILSVDHYRAFPRIVAIGIGPVPLRNHLRPVLQDDGLGQEAPGL